MAQRTTGTVRWFDGSRGYGYIRTEKGHEIFVHYSSILGSELQNLNEGEKVEFAVEETVRGLQATGVVRLN
ncbi:MAG: cold shock domain-containing protein [Anaerolineales bacterium]